MPYLVSTLADLNVALAGRVGGSVFWTPEEGRLALNETLRDWNLLTGRWRRRLTLSTVAPIVGVPQVELALGATMTYGMRIALSTGTPVIPTSILELDLGRPTWRSETIASGGEVPAVPTLWAPISLQRIAIWPATATAVVNYLLIEGVANTPVLVEAGDFVDLGEEIVDVLLDMAIHVIALKEAGPRWRATLPHFQAFLQAAAEENGLLKANQAFRRMAGLDRRRDLQKSKGAPNKLEGIAQAASSVGGGGGA